eukprot:14843394-Alexandrium_andersonii.AAC.1
MAVASDSHGHLWTTMDSGGRPWTAMDDRGWLWTPTGARWVVANGGRQRWESLLRATVIDSDERL